MSLLDTLKHAIVEEDSPPATATEAHELDLAAHGFAWEEDAYADKEFMVVEKELSGMF